MDKSVNRVSLGGRQAGHTSAAMLAAPKGAVYVWCSERLDYPRELAKKLGRDDLLIVTPLWIEERRWQGLQFSALKLDHAADLTQYQWCVFQDAKTRCRPCP